MSEKKLQENIKVNWTSILYYSLFLGFFGVDKFLMKKKLQGYLKLLSIGGLGIWWFIDIILILSAHNYENIKWIIPENIKFHRFIVLTLLTSLYIMGNIEDIISAFNSVK